jgi:hypothetical protein
LHASSLFFSGLSKSQGSSLHRVLGATGRRRAIPYGLTHVFTPPPQFKPCGPRDRPAIGVRNALSPRRVKRSRHVLRGAPENGNIFL